jgi:hypothetical protein
MKTVPLHGKKVAGRVALVDDEDYELVVRYHWNVQEDARPGHRSGPYARACVPGGGGRDYVFMHNLIAGYGKPDHIDGNGLNNQRSNLRPATSAQNSMNKRKRWRATSRYVGVCWYPNREKWLTRIYRNGTMHHLGYFSSEVEAALAYDAAAREIFGEYARPNFPVHQEAS